MAFLHSIKKDIVNCNFTDEIPLFLIKGIVRDNNLLDPSPPLSIAVDKTLGIYRFDPEISIQFLDFRNLGVAEHDLHPLLREPAEQPGEPLLLGKREPAGVVIGEVSRL